MVLQVILKCGSTWLCQADRFYEVFRSFIQTAGFSMLKNCRDRPAYMPCRCSTGMEYTQCYSLFSISILNSFNCLLKVIWNFICGFNLYHLKAIHWFIHVIHRQNSRLNINIVFIVNLLPISYPRKQIYYSFICNELVKFSNISINIFELHFNTPIIQKVITQDTIFIVFDRRITQKI